MSKQFKRVGLISLAVMAMIGAISQDVQAGSLGTKGEAVKVQTAPGKYSLYVGGLPDTASTGLKAEAIFPNATVIRKSKANACGLAVFTASTKWQQEDVASVDVATIPQQTLPKCSNGVLVEPRTGIFKTQAKEVVKVGLPGTEQTLTYKSSAKKTSSVKAGLAIFTGLDGTELVQVGTQYFGMPDTPLVTASPTIRSDANGNSTLWLSEEHF